MAVSDGHQEPAGPAWHSAAILALGAAYAEPSLIPAYCDKILDEIPVAINSQTRQLPVHGGLLLRIFSMVRSKKVSTSFIHEAFERLLQYLTSLYDTFDPLDACLAVTNDPARLGWPFNAVWQTGAARIDPVFNTLLIWSNEALIQIGQALKQDLTALIQWHELSIYAMNEYLWNDRLGLYLPYDLHGKSQIPTGYLGALLPMLAEIPTQEQAERLLQHLEKGAWQQERYLAAMLPGEDSATGHTAIDLFSNWMLYQGLLRYDMYEAAARVKNDTLALANDQGIFECYHPATGEGLRGYNSPYAAALLSDMLMK